MSEKVALISGGTSGIGLETARVLLAGGWSVAVNGRDAQRGETALASLSASDRAVFIEGDVAAAGGCREIVERTVRVFGRIDGLVTSAGYYEETLLENMTEEATERIFSVNVYGTVFLCKEALPYIKERHGAIVTVASDAGLQGNIGCSVYAATKGAVVAFSRSLALETAPHDVRVNCICPGDVRTPLVERQLAADEALTLQAMGSLYPLRRIAEPREIAKAVAFLLSEDASFITAVALPVDGGLTSW